ncbi:DUF6638 family protein [Albibacillus kandeliae]|uniref:DUF6638 family protein n=1 Tax=Albibacillus kandeliae TaxID=2174228 RepID=UPI000D6932E0|nr:DUF6638 family protein [Albibacillus kandeliae]
MKRLIEKGLMFGNLYRVTGAAMVERYNRALEHLTGRRTGLTDFHIDLSGYSPEVGDEFDDDLYLNHRGVNRQFILLSTDQKRCPLLNVKFSTSREILKRFITENEAQLFALTATDAVAGEMVNSVFDVSTPARLFDVGQVEIEADTTTGTIAHAEKLHGLVERFRREEDGWFDDVLIAEMIGLAQKSGDITRNPVRLEHRSYSQPDFWTAHFGGAYLFQSVAHPALIACGDKEVFRDVPIPKVFDLTERNRIARFFELNGLVEPVVKARGVDAAAILRQKMDFIVVDAAADLGLDLAGRSRADLRRLARDQVDRLPDAYHGLRDLVRWAEAGGRWPRIDSDDAAYFYSLRAADTPWKDLVNMLLAELAPLDIRQLFICHKELFYQLYRGWPDAKRSFVADFLAREYQVDKAGARAALFGSEPDMANRMPSAPVKDPVQEIVRRVGPWGAVRR